VLDHLSIRCADVEASAAFYDGVLAPLGGERIKSLDGPTIGYGVPPVPDFWLGPQTTGHAKRVVRSASTASITASAASVSAPTWRTSATGRTTCT